MSAIAGIVHFDGIPAAYSEVAPMDAALARLGPDGSRWISAGPAGMIFRAFFTTASTAGISPPHGSSELLTVFDGRLDNREELIRDLDLACEAPLDEDIVAAAFRRWGVEGISRLIGDYALAIWDGHARLILARDPFGARGLVFHRTPKRVLWASATDALLRCPRVEWEVDEVYVASYLAVEPDMRRTPFRFIHAVPPGFAVVFSEDGFRMCPIWRPISGCGEIRYRSDREYEDHFRELFEASVRCRLRVNRGPVMAQLSGGLDSSSIVCVADSLAARGEVDQRVEALSFVFDGAPDSDERRYIEAVEELRGKPGCHLREDDTPILDQWPDPEFMAFPNPVFCFGRRIRQVSSTMANLGARVLLSGLGGDGVMMAEERYPLEIADLLRRGRAAAALRALSLWSKSRRTPVFELIWKAGLKPNIAPRKRLHIPHWLPRDLVLRTGLEEEIRQFTDLPVPMAIPSASARFRAVLRAAACLAHGYATYQDTWGSVEFRFPFLDRRLVEFLLSIPPGQLMRPRENRSLQRRALTGILPEQVRLRRDKAGPTQAAIAAVNRRSAWLRQLIQQSRACAFGYVDRNRIAIELDRVRHGLAGDLVCFLRFLSLEMWLRGLESGRTRLHAMEPRMCETGGEFSGARCANLQEERR